MNPQPRKHLYHAQAFIKKESYLVEHQSLGFLQAHKNTQQLLFQ
jgi:hypothetical protein